VLTHDWITSESIAQLLHFPTLSAKAKQSGLYWLKHLQVSI